MQELWTTVSTPSLFTDAQELLPFDGSAVLFPRFLDADFARGAFDELQSATLWEQPEMIMFGKKYAQAGLSTWFTDSGISYQYSGILREAHPMTPLLAKIGAMCTAHTGAPFNSVLVNLYRDGQDSVSWHSDNEAVNGKEPTIASVSLRPPRRFDLRHKETKERVRAEGEN